MDGIGEKLVEQLLDAKLITSIAGLYQLTHDQLTSLERMGNKSANNILSELSRTNRMTLGKFIHALGIPGIGPELATLFASHVKTLDGMFDWLDAANAVPGNDKFGPTTDLKGKPHQQNLAIRDLCQYDGVGEKVAIQVRDGLELRRKLIIELSSHLDLDAEPILISGGKLDGMSFCVTGTLSQPRKAIQLMIKSAGGKVVGSISAKLDVLIAGENAGSKLAKAEALGVKVWDEARLLAALETPIRSPSVEDRSSNVDADNSQKSLLDF